MKNFTIIDEIYISIDSSENFDLHNNFDFSGLSLDFTNHSAKIKFNPYGNEQLSVIEIYFVSVNHLQFSENPFIQYSTAIDEIGYKEPDVSNMDWLLSEHEYQEGAHFVLRSTNGVDVRIGADKMIAKVSMAKPQT